MALSRGVARGARVLAGKRLFASATDPLPSVLLQPEWLGSPENFESVKFLDASWYLPNAKRDTFREWRESRISGSSFFDLEKVHGNLPSSEDFSDYVTSLGVGSRDSRIVVYDTDGFMSAPLVWYMLRAYGATNVALLSGGFPHWKIALKGEKVDTSAPSDFKADGRFEAKLDEASVRSTEQVQDAVKTQSPQIVDARSHTRWTGEEEDPRAHLGVVPGRIPSSKNVPFRSLSHAPRGDGNGQDLLPVEKLKEIFEKSGTDLSKPIITSCGSGVTAACLLFALEHIHQASHAGSSSPNLSLYHGSWAVWGSRKDLPIVLGEE